MTDYETAHAAAICPICGTKNQLTAAQLSSDQIIACSHCGTALGTWGGLVPAPKRRRVSDGGKDSDTPGRS